MPGSGPALPARAGGRSAPRVDFAFGASDRLLKACEVARKQVAAGRRLVVYTASAPRMTKFDRLLWQFEATAFVPHVMSDDPLAAQTPVLLEAQAPSPELAQAGAWLLNLDTECPPGAEHFERVLEIVSGHPEDKQAARQRWRRYQETGFELRAHDISGG